MKRTFALIAVFAVALLLAGCNPTDDMGEESLLGGTQQTGQEVAPYASATYVKEGR